MSRPYRSVCLVPAAVVSASALIPAAHAQAIPDGSITVNVESRFLLPDTRDASLGSNQRGANFRTRVNFVRSAPNGTLYANDQRGNQ